MIEYAIALDKDLRSILLDESAHPNVLFVVLEMANGYFELFR